MHDEKMATFYVAYGKETVRFWAKVVEYGICTKN